MESPRKFNDCYFYYYSTCTKGDNCVFRHEPSALGCETMCSAWQQGKCLDKRCKLRHMELRKNRKQIPCYWENQPGGCRKKHCPFMHKNPEARTDGIAPSQPGPVLPMQAVSPVGAGEVERHMPPTVAAPPPAPVSLLWQQQRQLVLDSALLGVLPGAGGGLVARRTIPGVEDGGPYAPIAVDPLVVNFEEESDNESAPSSTPTKCPPDDAQRIARTKSQELLLLERIQAEAAAYYNYDNLPPVAETPKERKIVRVRTTSATKLSLDELAGKQASTERRKSLDFKVLSLDEIRARKKPATETVVPTAPITLKLSRKRKSSTTETITTTGNKILKVVRSNSIVYKKIDKNAPTQSSQSKQDQKPQEVECRKRTLSEQTDLIYDMLDDELVDNCFEFKRIKITEQQSMKPVIIRNKHTSIDKLDVSPCDEADISNKTDNDSDSEVQIVSVDMPSEVTNVDEIIDLDDSKVSDEEVVDLSEDVDEISSSHNVELVKNVPDIVASCQKNASKSDEINNIVSDVDEDALLNDDDDL